MAKGSRGKDEKQGAFSTFPRHGYNYLLNQASEFVVLGL
jgi:hypothetical protein